MNNIIEIKTNNIENNNNDSSRLLKDSGIDENEFNIIPNKK